MMLDETDRAQGRDRALNRTLVSSLGLQAATVLGSFIALPFVTRSLSGAEFGVVATLTGFQALIGIADLGVGTALSYRVATLVAHAQPAGRTVAAGLVVTGGSAAVIAGGGMLLGFTLPWADLLNTGGVTTSQVRLAVIAAAAAIGLSTIGSLGYRLLFALQQGGRATWTMALGTSLGAAATICATQFDAGPWVVVLTMLGVPALVSVAATGVVVLYGAAGSLRPSFSDLGLAHLVELLSTSRWFWLISLAGAAAFQADTVIVAGFTTAATAGVFAIVLRVFGLVSQAIQPWILQLGPSFADALARGDTDWLRRRLVRSSVQTLLATAAAGALVVAIGPPAIGLWLGEDLAPDRSVLVPAAIWTAITLAIEPCYLLIQAVGWLRLHAAIACAMAITNVGLSIWFTSMWGASGPLWGSVAATVLCTIAPGLVAARRALVSPRVRGSA